MAHKQATQELAAALAELSVLQREVVDWDGGALLALAGPGSGKTRVLTCRIARLLEGSVEQSFRILALTFTNKAADEMRQRVERYVPGYQHRLFLGTFHSFCAEILRVHGSHVGVHPDFSLYSERSDRLAILAQAARKIGSDVGELENALAQIEAWQAALVTPEGATTSHGDSEQLAALYRAYNETMTSINALDFGALLSRAHQVLQIPALAKHYRRVYRYWCIDEFQDTNQAQYSLLQTMAAKEFCNVFAVADDDQLIYEWNGASHRRLEDFREEFQADLIQLPVNYRCPTEVVELANRLIVSNLRRTPGKQLIQAGRQRPSGLGTVRLRRFDDDQDEIDGVAEDIIKRQLTYSSVSVLARTRASLVHLRKALEGQGVAAVLSQRRDQFLSPQFRWLYACLKQSLRPGDARVLEVLMGSHQQMTGIALAPSTVATRALTSHGHLLRAWTEEVGRMGHPHKEVEAVANLLLDGADFQEFISFSLAWFAEAADCGEGTVSDYQEDLLAWGELTRSLRNSTLSAYLQELDMHSKEPPPDPQAVTLSTIHAAKGREFDHVYLMGLADQILPSYQALKHGDTSPQLEEERRNCFVAITRTKITLTLTFASTYRGWAKDPSRFLEEMGIDMA